MSTLDITVAAPKGMRSLAARSLATLSRGFFLFTPARQGGVNQ